jgi:peroxidase
MCDKYFDPDCLGNASLTFYRSNYVIRNRSRALFNSKTAWIDASQIYGVDEASSKAVRDFKNGKLKTNRKLFLPNDEEGHFIAGDSRINETIGVSALYTIFTR